MPTITVLDGDGAARTARAAAAWCPPGDPGWQWILAAGVVPSAAPPLSASATGRPTLLLGMVRDDPTWRTWLRDSGGDGDRRALPALPAALVLDPALGARWGSGVALRDLLADPHVRRIHVPALDVERPRGQRVVQVVTSLQRGGAERIALLLHQHGSAHDIDSRLLVVGPPQRGTYTMPDAATLIHGATRSERMAAAATVAAQWGADVVHAHLLGPVDLQAFRDKNIPCLLTMHNVRAGWSIDVTALPHDVLVVACAHTVERDLRAAAPGLRLRTVVNGITALPRADGQHWRRAKQIPAATRVLLTVANPRPQKRLELVPEILARLSGVHWVLAGEAGHDPAAQAAEAALVEAIGAHCVADRVHRLGAVADLSPVYAAADALIAPSRWEGLSLAWLEALSAGLPVLSTDAGDASAVPGITVLPQHADAEAWAVELRRMLDLPRPVPRLAAPHTATAMAAAYARLYPAAAATPPGSGVWLVINNLAIGGAQSSARRLLNHWHDSGLRVRVAVLEEHPAHPTPGRTALLNAGITVAVEGDALRLAALIRADPPAAVLLWNALPRSKIALVERLVDTRCFDVSPGDMNLASLREHCANSPLPTLATYAQRLAGAVVKHAGEASAAQAGFGCPVTVIANGITLPALPSLPRKPDGLWILGTAVRLSPQKRLEDLFAALRLANTHLPPWELHLAGAADGEAQRGYAAELQAGARDLPIRWLGQVDDPTPVLHALDLFVLIAEPAGCPNASLEAMAHGCAVLATDVGGMREQVEPSVTGWLSPARDTPALAQLLIHAASDRERLRQMGLAGRERIRERFSLERMADAYARLLRPP